MAKKRKSIILIGFDLDIIDLIESLPEFELKGYVDAQDKSDILPSRELSYLGSDKDGISLAESGLAAIFSMNMPHIRKQAMRAYPEFCLINVVSFSAHISPRAVLGPGSIIQHGSALMPLSVVGKGCIIHPHVLIHHESEIGDYATVSSGAIVLGRVKTGSEVFIGAGAIIRENCIIGNGAVIGAGAVVVKDVPAGAVVAGVPAGQLKGR